jgi:hypothetical protein
MDQTKIIDKIKFGKQDTTAYPVIASTSYTNIVVEAYKYESLKQFEITDKIVLSQIKKMLKPLVESKYNIEYFYVKQRIHKEIKVANLCHHGWYFNKVTNKFNMNDTNMRGTLNVGAVAVTDYIAPIKTGCLNGKRVNCLTFNSFAERDVHIRRQSRFPIHENSFKFTYSNDGLYLEMVSIAYSEELKKAVATLHVFVVI